ncbi:MAG: AbrB/MazE/SpoVT family DNA-binding domain-containing protein [Vicinamibacteria bacterium]|jgi:antitoxin component of MazEF toxin-antitoxin module|nr:AbrB/MazE/SpoVT family DNA-binding domain-containing protein [Vicinamibacteria bacterium]
MENAMIKQLTVIGNSLRLIIDKPILDLLYVDKDTPLELSTDGQALIVRPAVKGHKRRVKAAAERLMDAHDATLRELAK